MEIQDKNNKLIAEFMGRKGKHNPELYTWKGITVLTDDIWFYVSDAKFHKSWDWLMPVIKKIDSEANTEMDFADFDNYRSTWVMIDKPSKYDIDYVYRQVVDYLTNKKVV
jgi:hypothetical protein